MHETDSSQRYFRFVAETAMWFQIGPKISVLPRDVERCDMRCTAWKPQRKASLRARFSFFFFKSWSKQTMNLPIFLNVLVGEENSSAMVVTNFLSLVYGPI